MDPVRLCFENKKILSFSYTKKTNSSNQFEFGFFPPYFDGTLFVYRFIMQINITFRRFKESLA